MEMAFPLFELNRAPKILGNNYIWDSKTPSKLRTYLQRVYVRHQDLLKMFKSTLRRQYGIVYGHLLEVLLCLKPSTQRHNMAALEMTYCFQVA